MLTVGLVLQYPFAYLLLRSQTENYHESIYIFARFWHVMLVVNFCLNPLLIHTVKALRDLFNKLRQVFVIQLAWLRQT